eukprot:1136993-Pelagomonas_calceolata.AAC.13
MTSGVEGSAGAFGPQGLKPCIQESSVKACPMQATSQNRVQVYCSGVKVKGRGNTVQEGHLATIHLCVDAYMGEACPWTFSAT